jgi:Rieske 2Fe-2S protein
MRQADFEPLRRPLDEASHAPGWLYASPDVYRLEVERLFMKSWLFVGREEELPRVGDYLTVRVAGEPIVVARDADGALRAFYNMCADALPFHQPVCHGGPHTVTAKEGV